MKQEMAPLIQELKRRKETRLDLVVDSRSLNAESGEHGIIITVPKHDGYPLTPWAHGQMAQKMGIPVNYYNKVLDAKFYSLLASNINAWLHTEDKRMLRILDGNIRAVLSDRYKVLDNFDMLFHAMVEFEQAGALIVKADLTETHLYVKAVTPKLQGEIRPGDVIQGGVILKNSEVGASRFTVQPFVLRLKCSNGLVVEQGYSRVHLGSRKEEGEFRFSSQTIGLENKAIWSAVSDVIRNTFDPAEFDRVVQMLKGNAETEIKAPIQAVDNVIIETGISDEQKQAILENLIADKDHTQWGMVNAITATARGIKDPDLQVELETKAGEIAFMAPNAFMKLVDAAPKTRSGKIARKLAEGDNT